MLPEPPSPTVIMHYSFGTSTLSFLKLSVAALAFVFVGCSEESAEALLDENNAVTPPAGCTNVVDYRYLEADGFVKVQFEETLFDDAWKLNKDGDITSGKGYMVWTGEQSLQTPGLGLATYTITIGTSGTYRFLWKSAVKMGNSGSDHNDTWLRFPDAADFYAQKDASIVYPEGSGKTPNPEGATAEGWFKVYRSGNDLDFKWQANTFDNNAHAIYVSFDEPGNYVMEISARSSGHAIDQFVLFQETLSKEDAISDSRPFSAIACD